MQRIQGVQVRATSTAIAHGALPGAVTQVGQARKAVTEPDAEAVAKAQAQLMEQVKAAPSQEIVKLGDRIREVIKSKRPPDEDALMAAEPESAAAGAGQALNASVGAETSKVQGNYGPINDAPPVTAPAKGAELQGQPAVAATAPVDATAATPDAVPAGNVSLDQDAAQARDKADAAGMHTPAADLVKSGPVAQARDAQGELDQAAKQDPAKILAGQKQALGKAEGDMAALQAQALAALEASRDTKAKGATTRQGDLVQTEESMRAAAATDAKKVFDDARALVTAQLKDLPATAMEEWDRAKDVLASQFKANLASVQERVKERHSGAPGFVVGLWDAVTGLPSWAEEKYTVAENAFAEGVIAKLLEISAKVNSVILACDQIIKNARERITQIFDGLGPSAQAYAEQEKAKFNGQLDQLHSEVAAARDDFTKNLVKSASAAVDEVRAEISELRKKAGGLVGRIAGAINRFIEDPVKFILEGLLELLGIPPASFWAVVAKIKKFIKQIADDPLTFANNLLKGLAEGFGLFFSNFAAHMLRGFLGWLLGGVKDVQIPKELSVKSVVTFFLQLMGITWPNIRKILVKLVGAKNVALVEKVYSLVSVLMEKGPEGIYEMIKEKLDPQSIVDQVVQLAVDFMVSAIIKQATARIIALFNPAGAILQALEAIYRVLKWIFQNAAKIFSLVETVVNGIGEVLAGNTAGFAAAVEKGLAMLISPVISFIADYLSLGDLPDIVATKVKSMREWILGMIEKALTWLIEKGKALLAAMGIGKKKEKEQQGTPHEQAVKEVAAELAEPDDADEGLDYQALRTKVEQQAAPILAARNQSLAAEKVKMSVTFADPATDAQDNDIDFNVMIAPNSVDKNDKRFLRADAPIGGHHPVRRAKPKEKEESHHVPAKALGMAIGSFLKEVSASLLHGQWKGNAAAQTVATAFDKRGSDSEKKVGSDGDKLSAILLNEASHRGSEGVHKRLASSEVMEGLSKNPATQQIILVRRLTLDRLGIRLFSVNPRSGHWQQFLSDVRHAILGRARGEELLPAPAQLILKDAESQFEAAEGVSRDFLKTHVVDATNGVLKRAVVDGYHGSRAIVAAAMKRSKYGDANEQAEALGELDAAWDDSWHDFYDPIEVTFPPDEGDSE